MHQLITLFRQVTLAFEARFFKAELINVNNEFYYTIGKLPSEKVVQNRSKLSKFEKNSGHCTHVYVANDHGFTWKRRGEITQIFTANSFTKYYLRFVKIGKHYSDFLKIFFKLQKRIQERRRFQRSIYPNLKACSGQS